ncbi:MAG TPA: hypothetical protein DCL38_03560 [Lachnospiraceae bacterium]|nr:hypothetical protein [Lachnospiraceae bacterium]
MDKIELREIINAIEDHQIQGYYQPKYNATTGRLVSAEILSRWYRAFCWRGPCLRISFLSSAALEP